jgi:hypothetical protein
MQLKPWIWPHGKAVATLSPEERQQTYSEGTYRLSKKDFTGTDDKS